MSTRLNPYLTFDGKLTLNTFAEAGASGEGVDGDKIMHAHLETSDGMTLMASDLAPGMEHRRGNDIAVSLSGDDGEALRRYWEKLSDGGTVAMPLEKQMWGDEFGMCTDRYGVSWMVNIAGSQA